MLIYLDTAIVIYAIEGNAHWKGRAMARLQAAHLAGDDLVTSHLTLAECLVKPLRIGDSSLEADYRTFLSHTFLVEHPLEVFDRLAHIRATTTIKIPDALHLATAIHHGCDVFLTNDDRLSTFADVPVEVLP
jgi:predicted nucleic acid-binding protein